jgi:putative ABC transport system substrate-binding protein
MPTAPPVSLPTPTPPRRAKTPHEVKGAPDAVPTGTAGPGVTPSRTPAPTRTPPLPTPTPVPTQSLSSKRVLLLQSDSAVAVYRDTALRIVGGISAQVDLRDLHGDREQGLDAVRQTNADLIVAIGSLAATVAREEAGGRPVLFCAVLNPERYKLAGAGLGGVSFEISAADQLERLHSALPNVTRVGVIYDPQKSAGVVAAAELAAARLGLQIVKAEAKEPREVDPVFRSLRREIDVLWIIPDSTVVTRESFEILALQAAESRIPFVAFSEAFARQGALLAMYPDPSAIGDQCAGLAVQVLRGNVTMAEIGVRAPDRYRVAVNRRVEDQLGVKIAPTLRADVEIR